MKKAIPLKLKFVAAALFLVSASSLIFEITLIRIFSLLFNYHYVFLAASVAVLGLGLGGVLGRFLFQPESRSRRKFRRQSRNAESFLLPLFLLSICFPLSSAFLARLPVSVSVFPHALAALLPFLLTGLFTSRVFAVFSSYSGLLYGADLIGAAFGVFAVLGLLRLWGAFNTIISLGILIGASYLLVSQFVQGRHHLKISIMVLACNIGMVVLNLFSGLADFEVSRTSGAARDKTMFALLNDPAHPGRIVYTRWDSFARVDVVESEDPGVKYLFTDGGAGSSMYAFSGEPAELSFLQDSLEYLPFTGLPVRNVLVIGAGGGKDILLALLAGARTITAVEINPAVVRAVRRFAGFNGSILNRPGVDLVVGDARTFVERSGDQYDLIYLNIVYTQAAEPGARSLVENYIFTKEAFRSFLAHLAPGGRLVVVSHNALEGSRAAITALKALADKGIPPEEGLFHLALFMLPEADPTLRTSLMVFGKDELTREEIKRLAEGANHLGLMPLHLPAVFEAAFAPLKQNSSLEEFSTADPNYDLKPTSDDRPFFFKLNPGLPEPVRRALAASLALGGLVFGLVMAIGFRRRVIASMRTGYPTSATALFLMAACFAFLGAGFMMVELSMIQRFQLLLGHPVLSFSLVLGVMLVGGGLGSLASERIRPEKPLSVLSAAVFLIGVFLLVYRLILNGIIHQLLTLSLLSRCLALAAVLLPLSFFMGMPFPSLIRLSRCVNPQEIPLLWGVNGIFSVLGSVLSLVIAMRWGFGRTLFFGALCYAAVFLCAACLTVAVLRRSGIKAKDT